MRVLPVENLVHLSHFMTTYISGKVAGITRGILLASRAWLRCLPACCCFMT